MQQGWSQFNCFTVYFYRCKYITDECNENQRNESTLISTILLSKIQRAHERISLLQGVLQYTRLTAQIYGYKHMHILTNTNTHLLTCIHFTIPTSKAGQSTLTIKNRTASWSYPECNIGNLVPINWYIDSGLLDTSISCILIKACICIKVILSDRNRI